MREAMYYDTGESGVVCRLCPKECRIGEGKSGFCRVRRASGNKLYSLNYGACSSYAIDPIEKKPLYHFYPGSLILSLGTWGCNFACSFCQNWHIAQSEPPTNELPPRRALELALEAGRNNIGIAYTYSEPSVWYEYVYDTARLLKEQGLKNVLVTNGFIRGEPLDALLPYIDALNIDVKAFNEDYYRKICAGRLAEVQRTVEQAAAKAHVEITCLVVPGLNDEPGEIEAMAKWLAGIGKDIPLHFSRYFPNYKLDAPPTPLETLERSYEIARRYLNYVYVGNAGHQRVNTDCPVCGQLVIDRMRRVSHLTDNKKCPRCGGAIYVVGEVCYN